MTTNTGNTQASAFSDGNAAKRPAAQGFVDISAAYAQKFGIANLPSGYVALEKTRTNGTAKDTWVWGHPTGKRFNSAPQFKVHLDWLQSHPTTSACLCVLCSPGPRQPKKNRRPRQVGFADSDDEVEQPTKKKRLQKAAVSSSSDETEQPVVEDNDHSDDDEILLDEDAIDYDADPTPLFSFSSLPTEYSQRRRLIKRMGHLMEKGFAAEAQGDDQAHAAMMDAAKATFYLGIGRVAWHAISDKARAQLLDDIQGQIEGGELGEEVEDDLREVFEELTDVDVINKPFYNEEDEGDSEIAPEHIDAMQRVFDAVISECGCQTAEPVEDIDELHPKIVDLLESVAPLALKFDLICLYVGNIADFPEMWFEPKEPAMMTFLDVFKNNFWSTLSRRGTRKGKTACQRDGSPF